MVGFLAKNAVQFPLAFIIFLIIIVIIVALMLMWNLSGFDFLDKIFNTAGTTVMESSGGAVDALVK